MRHLGLLLSLVGIAGIGGLGMDCADAEPPANPTGSATTEAGGAEQASAGGGAAGAGWQLLERGTQAAISEPEQRVIGSQAELEQIWQRAFDDVDRAPTIPKVDFSKHRVVALFLGQTSSAGHELAISQVAKGAGGTVVTVQHAKPGSGCMTAAVIEYPYLFAAIPRAGAGGVRFETRTVARPCE